MRKSLPEALDLHGSSRWLFYDPDDTGINLTALAVNATAVSRALSIVGYQHFQAWLTFGGAGTVGVEIAAYHPRTRVAMAASCVLGNLVATGANLHTIYFGIGLDPPASAAGDKVRFSRLLRVTLRNNGAAPVTVSLGLEAMG